MQATDCLTLERNYVIDMVAHWAAGVDTFEFGVVDPGWGGLKLRSTSCCFLCAGARRIALLPPAPLRALPVRVPPVCEVYAYRAFAVNAVALRNVPTLA